MTNTIQLAELQEKSLHTKQSADVIQKKIRQKRVAEANRLFQESASDMEKDDREKLSKQLSALVEQADKYFCEGDTLETERKLKQAREKYKKVEDIAIDYPELPEALRRLDDAIALIRALEYRAKRRTSRQDKQSALLTTPSQSGQSRRWLPLLACFSLLLIMVGAGLSYTDNLDLAFTFTEKDKTTALKQQTQKKALSKEEVGKQQDSLKQVEQIANNPDGLEVGMTLVIPTLSETGNVLLSPSSSASPPVLNEDGTYTVQSGDSLGIISQKLFGNAWKWKKIYELNNDVLTAPHKLKVGQILKVKASGSVKETIESSEPESEEERPAFLTFMAGSNYIDSQ